MTMPATGVIDSIFDGISQAFADVSGAVNNHTDRLADNPCAWRNELYPKIERLTARLQASLQIANRIAEAGPAAVDNAKAVGGFAVPGRQFNSGALQSFGAWLRDAGYPIGPPVPLSLVTFPFVRRGEPRKAFTLPIPQGGAGLDANGKLAGPAIFAEWEAWSEYVEQTAEPRGPVRQRGNARGWRAILASLVGSSDWRNGEPIAEQSSIGQAIQLREIALQALQEARNACDIYSPTNNDTAAASDTGTAAQAGPAVKAASLAALWYFL